MRTENVSQIEGIDPPATDQLGSMTHEEYEEWNRTGKLPEAAREAAPEPEDHRGESASPEPSESIESRKRSTRERFDELLSERKQTKARIAKLEAELEAARQAKVEMKPAPPAESAAAAPEPEPKPAVTGPYKASAKAKAELDRINADYQAGKYASYEEYSDEKAAVIAEDRLEQREAARAAQKQAEEKANREKTAKEQFDRVLEGWNESVKLAKTVHPDFQEVAGPLMGTTEIPGGSYLEGWILDSPVGTEILYHFGSHRDELKSLLAKPVFAQSRELTKLETQLQDGAEHAEPASQDDSPKPRKATAAPEPAKELGTGGGATRDAVDQAVKSNDVESYIREANARDLHRMKARRG